MTQPALEHFRIKSSFGDYSVIEVNSEDALYSHLQGIKDPFFLVDSNVHKTSSLDRRFPRNRTFVVEATEAAKNLETVDEISAWLSSAHADKQSTLVAIGGGIVQDLATFTAAIYFRGIKWIFVPTTLLAMSDSCIGAKCALNVQQHKNQIGLIYAPSQVILFQAFLSTLSDDLIVSGLGEILKLSLTGPNQFFETFIEKANRKESAFELALLALKAKQAVIEIDELELDTRRILNYGHSFGHAIEAISKGKISHGQAVVFGIDIINYLGEEWGITPFGVREKVRNVSEAVFPKMDWPRDPSLPRKLVDELRHDKKIHDGKLVFAILEGVGEISLVPKSLDESLIDLVESYFESESQHFLN
jgi:3-dehydroquinate synthase